MTIIDDLWDLPSSALCGRDRLDSIDLGDADQINSYLETDDGRGYHVFGVLVSTEFAREQGDIQDGHVDEDGHLTTATLESVAEWVTTYLRETVKLPEAAVASLEISATEGDADPAIDISVSLPADGRDTVRELVETVVNPMSWAIRDISDPGTFNTPYLWSAVPTL